MTRDALPGVSVQLRTRDSRQIAETVTDRSGQYRLGTGDFGPYELRFSLTKFMKQKQAETV